MQKVKNVINLMFLVFLLFGCSSLHTVEQDNIKITRLKSKDFSSHIVIQTYDFEYKTELLDAFININNIYFDKMKVFTVIPGTFKIKAYFVGKDVLNHNKLLVKKGDSIIVKMYLKDSNQPIY